MTFAHIIAANFKPFSNEVYIFQNSRCKVSVASAVSLKIFSKNKNGSL